MNPHHPHRRADTIEAIALEVLIPPRAHPLAAHFRAHVEALGRRPDTALRELDPGAPFPPTRSTGRPRARLVLGLAPPTPFPRDEVPTLTLALDAPDRASPSDLTPAPPTWLIAPPSHALPGYDGLTRVHLLAQAAAAVLDHLAASPDPGAALQALIAASPHRDGLTLVLPATAHLSARALHELLATRVASEAARTLAEAITSGDDWEALDWELPAALDTEAVVLAATLDDPRALQTRARHEGDGLPSDRRGQRLPTPGAPPDPLTRLLETASESALAAAEHLLGEVHASVDDALATHGLAALRPLRRALLRMRDAVAQPPRRDPVTSPTAAPSARAVTAAERHLAALARPVRGQGLLVAAWSLPTAALVALSVGPGLSSDPRGPALAAAGSLAISALGAGLSRAVAAWRLSHARRTLAEAQQDLAERLRATLRARIAREAPAASAPARAWLLAQLGSEDRRLEALEATTLAEARPRPSADPASEPASRPLYRALSLAPLAALLAPRPDALLAQIRAELRGPWRQRLPTLATLTEVARAHLPRHLPWGSRRDLGPAIAPALGAALDALDAELERARPSGSASRRLAFLPSGLLDALVGAPAAPAPPHAGTAALTLHQRLRVDTEPLPSSGDAHLLVLWGPS